MADQMKKYTIELFGESYTIVSDEPSDDLTQAVEYFNQCMEILSSESGLKEAKKVALLTGLQLSQELLRMQRNVAKLESSETKVQSLLEKISSL